MPAQLMYGSKLATGLVRFCLTLPLPGAIIARVAYAGSVRARRGAAGGWGIFLRQIYQPAQGGTGRTAQPFDLYIIRAIRCGWRSAAGQSGEHRFLPATVLASAPIAAIFCATWARATPLTWTNTSGVEW